MAEYYVDTEHVRGEPRIYWVAERNSAAGKRRDKAATDATTDKRKADSQCAKLNLSNQTGARRVPLTSSVDGDGKPICCYCQKRMRWLINGWGYNGSGHFCSMRCAAEWADRKVEGTSDD